MHGTSQSTGRLDADAIGERWRDDIRHLRVTGFARLIVVRLGALRTFGALDGEALLGRVARAPIASGRRHLRELRVVQSDRGDAPQGVRPGLSMAGFDIPPPVLDRLAALDLTELEHVEPGPVLLLDTASLLDAQWVDRFATHGVEIERRVSSRVEDSRFGDEDKPGPAAR